LLGVDSREDAAAPSGQLRVVSQVLDGAGFDAAPFALRPSGGLTTIFGVALAEDRKLTRGGSQGFDPVRHIRSIRPTETCWGERGGRRWWTQVSVGLSTELRRTSQRRASRPSAVATRVGPYWIRCHGDRCGSVVKAFRSVRHRRLDLLRPSELWLSVAEWVAVF
jgi:hypothetical protein